jgi:3-dehydroquinate synthase
MASVDLKLPHDAYTVLIEPGLLDQLGPLVRAVAPHERACLIIDEAVFESCGATARRSLESAGYHVVLHVEPIDEHQKSLDTVRRFYDVMVDGRLERRSPVISLGGGVLGDTVGFTAATYLRGVPFVQCPTSLLSMVDASVGGKVGVNLPQGKNLIGAFHQPRLVVIDTGALSTLPARELRCGLAECVKHGVNSTRTRWSN